MTTENTSAFNAPDPAVASAESEIETPETEIDENEPEKATLGDDSDEGKDDQEKTEGDGSDEDDELEELDWGGKKYKLHRDLKPALMMQADYTRKTQEVAETKRSLEADKTAFNQAADSHRALMGEYAKVYALDMQIQRLASTDMAKLEADDLLAPSRLLWQVQQLKDARQQLADGIQQKEHERSQAAQREDAKHLEDFRRDLSREFPDWSDDLNGKMSNFARASGFTDDELTSIRDVRYLKVLRQAMEGAALSEKLRKQAADAKKKIRQEIKPLDKPAKGAAPARTGLDDDMPIDDWIKLRNKQVAARGY